MALTELNTLSDHIFNVIHNVIQYNSQFPCKKQLGHAFALMDLKKKSFSGSSQPILEFQNRDHQVFLPDKGEPYTQRNEISY